MAVKVVLFDADGVVITGKRFSYYLENDLGVSKELSLPFFENVFPHCVIGKKDLKEEITPFLEKWGWKKGVDEFLLYWFDSENVIDQLLLGSIRELRKKDIICSLATNQEKHRTEYIIERMYFKDKFDHVFSSAHIGHAKPDHGFFQHILDNLAVEKDEVLFWDDNAENVQVANDFGIQSFVYEGHKPFKKQLKTIMKEKNG